MSVADGSLVCSTLHRLNLTVSVGLISLMAGLALAQAVAELGVSSVGLKWPNDLVLGDRKLGGILIEGRIQGSEYGCVIGVGVNVITPDVVDQPAVGLAHEVAMEPRDIISFLAGRYLEGLSRWEERLEEGDADAILEGYRSRCLTLERRVTVITPEGEQRGEIRDVLADGSLLMVDLRGREVVIMPESGRHLRYLPSSSQG